jgi:hypothetical protein
VPGTGPAWGEDPTTAFTVLARDTGVDYELEDRGPRAKLIAVAHRDLDGGWAKSSPPQRPIWSRDLPRKAGDVAGDLEQGVLYVAASTTQHCDDGPDFGD